MKLYRINALLLKYYYIGMNRFDRVFDVFYWPLLDVVLWGFASIYIEQISSVNILSMILGGVTLWTFAWRAAQDMGVFVLEDFWSWSLYHLFSSPVKMIEHIISIIIFGFLRGAASFLILAAAAFFLYSFNLFVVPFKLIATAIFLLSLFGWAVGLFITSCIYLFGKRIQVIAWSVVWLMQPFSCVFYPLDALPPWAQVIAQYMPTTYIFENLRNFWFNGVVSYGQLWYSFIANLVLIVACSLFMKYSFGKARETGLLAKSE